MRNDRVIARKLRYLEIIPDISGTSGFAEEKKRRALTRNFVVNINIAVSDRRHLSLSTRKLAYDTREENAIVVDELWRLTLFRVL